MRVFAIRLRLEYDMDAFRENLYRCISFFYLTFEELRYLVLGFIWYGDRH